MRRKDRMITKRDAFSILERGEYGILSTVSVNKEPYGVPLNYCVLDKCIYFHCAPEGCKIDNIAENPGVSFCVVGKTEVLPERFGTKYESCIITGDCHECFAAEKQKALEGLVRRYSGPFVSEGLKYIEKQKDNVRVFRITIQAISGKARR